MSPERRLTGDDWRALYMVMCLFRQVSIHGRSALLPFARAIVECEDGAATTTTGERP